MIRHKFIVEESNIPYSEDIDIVKEFYTEKGSPEHWASCKRYSKFVHIETTENEDLSYTKLCDHGLAGAPRGAVCLSDELLSYIEEHF